MSRLPAGTSLYWPARKAAPFGLIVTLCVAGSVIANTAPGGGAARAADTTRTIYFAARSANGAPVTDLRIADLSLTAVGESWPIVQLRKATTPMDVAVIIGDSGSAQMNRSLLEFVQHTLSNGKFSIRVLDSQPLKIVDYTDDPNVLQSAILRLHQRPLSVVTTYLADAINEAAQELRKRRSARPVILVLTRRGERVEIDAPGGFNAGGEYAAMADAALTSLRRSGASLQVLMEAGPHVGQILGAGSAQSGGTIAFISHNGLKTIRETLLSQYELVYDVLDGYRADDRIALRTDRPGVSLIAPATAAR